MIYTNVKLGSVLVDDSGDEFICIREQEDPAFVMLGPDDLVDGTHQTEIFLLGWLVENFSPVTVDGDPLKSRMEEPILIGTVVTSDSALYPWVKVAPNCWVVSTDSIMGRVSWTWERIVNSFDDVKVGY